jgi:hypothetical protein
MSGPLLVKNTVIPGVMAGMGATLFMDISNAALRRLDFPSGVPLRFGAKWINYAARRGKLIHANIAMTPAIPVSVPLVLAVHYSIGVVLGVAYLVLVDALSLDRGSNVLAVLYGGATTTFAWLFMLPAMGYGVAGSKAPREWRVWLSSGVGHLLYGAGLAIFLNLVRYTSGRDW